MYNFLPYLCTFVQLCLQASALGYLLSFLTDLQDNSIYEFNAHSLKNLPLCNDFYVFFFSVHKEYTTKFYLFILPAWKISIKFRAHIGARKDYFVAKLVIFLLCFITL